MTAEEKKARRKLKHELQASVLKNHFHQHKFSATDRQLKASSRKVADQLLAGRNPNCVVMLP